MAKIVEDKITLSARTVANKHKVSQNQWRKWNTLARKVFNEVYSTMKRNQPLFLHPKQSKTEPKLWNTTAWNAAWIAADAIKGNKHG